MEDLQEGHFIGLSYNEKGNVKQVRICKSKQEAQDWLEQEQEVKSDNSKSNPSPNSDRKEPPYFSIFRRLEQLVEQQRRAIVVASAVQKLGNQVVDDRILGPLSKRSPVFEHEKKKLFNVAAEELPEFQKTLRSAVDYDKAAKDWPSALLMNLVANFESVLIEVLTVAVRENGAQNILADQTIAASSVFNAFSLDELKDSIIKAELEDLLWKGRSDQIDYIGKKLGVKIKDDWPRYGDFLEVFERRNLVAHGESIFTKRYCERVAGTGKCSTAGSEGEPLAFQPAYIRSALDVTTEFLALLSFMLWRKVEKDKDDIIFNSLNDFSYSMIRGGRSELAKRLLEYTTSMKNVGCTQKTRLMMTVNLASAHKSLGKTEDMEKVLLSQDWTACSDDFTISILSLRGKVDEVLELMPKVKESNLVRAQAFREWPVFRELRTLAAFREKFEAVFGEPLSINERTTTSETLEQAEEQVASDEPINGTIH